MTTTTDSIAVAKSIAGDLTDLIKENSIAYQICGVQFSESTSPLLFGVKKGSTEASIQIVSKEPTRVFDTGSTPATDYITEETIEDIFNIFGKNAKEMLKTIAANSICTELDKTIVDHMYRISTKQTDATYDFSSATDHRILIHNLMLRINQERMIMAKSLSRGLPRYLVVSPGVAAILITNKMVSGNDSDFVAGGRDNTKFIGTLGDMVVYMADPDGLDNVSTEFVMIAHKSYLAGDSSMIIVPIHGPKASFIRDKETGQPALHYTQKYAYGQNPLDATAVSTELTDAVFTAADDSINSAAGGLDLLYAVGDNIQVSAANLAANDGHYVVESIPNENKIIVEGDVITGDTAETATLTKYNSDFISSFDLVLTGFTV